ncbi:MAG: hypothetical protein JWQ72_3564 [Polaromonas sp.]|nr:hypothetical protein [Polaromonas sp.]
MVSDDDIRVTAQQHGVAPGHICPCESLEDLDAWAPGDAGQRKVRRALAENWLFFGNMRELAEKWMTIKATETQESALLTSVGAAHRTAAAAEKSARWAMWAAVAAALGTFVTAALAAVEIFAPGPRLLQLKVEPIAPALKAEKSLSHKPGEATRP